MSDPSLSPANTPRSLEVTDVHAVESSPETTAVADKSLLERFDDFVTSRLPEGFADKAKNLGGRALELGERGLETAMSTADKLLKRANEIAKKNPIAGAIMTAGLIFGGLWLTKKAVEGVGSIFKSIKDKFPGFSDILKMRKWTKIAGIILGAGGLALGVKKAWDLLKDEFKDCDTDEKKRAKAKEIAKSLPLVPDSLRDELESALYWASKGVDVMDNAYEKLKKEWEDQIKKIKDFCEKHGIELIMPDFAKAFVDWTKENPGKTATIALILSWWFLKKGAPMLVGKLFSIRVLAIATLIGTLCTLFFISDEKKQKLYEILGLRDVDGNGTIEIAENVTEFATKGADKGIEVLKNLKSKFDGFLDALGITDKTAQNLISLFALWKTSKFIMKHPKGALEFGTIAAVAYALFKIFESKEVFADETAAIKKAVQGSGLKIDSKTEESIIDFFLNPIQSAKNFREENKDSLVFSSSVGAINLMGTFIGGVGSFIYEFLSSLAEDENGNTNTKKYFADLQNKINKGEEISQIAEIGNFLEALYQDGKEIIIFKEGWAIRDGAKFLTIKFGENMIMPIVNIAQGKFKEAFEIWCDSGGAIFFTIGGALGGIKGAVKLSTIPPRVALKAGFEVIKTLASPTATWDMVYHSAARRAQRMKRLAIERLSLTRRFGHEIGLEKQWESLISEYDHFEKEIYASKKRVLTSQKKPEMLAREARKLEEEIKDFKRAHEEIVKKSKAKFAKGDEAELLKRIEALEKGENISGDKITPEEYAKSGEGAPTEKLSSNQLDEFYENKKALLDLNEETLKTTSSPAEKAKIMKEMAIELRHADAAVESKFNHLKKEIASQSLPDNIRNQKIAEFEQKWIKPHMELKAQKLKTLTEEWKIHKQAIKTADPELAKSFKSEFKNTLSANKKNTVTKLAVSEKSVGGKAQATKYAVCGIGLSAMLAIQGLEIKKNNPQAEWFDICKELGPSGVQVLYEIIAPFGFGEFQTMYLGKEWVGSMLAGEERKVEGIMDRYVIRGFFGTISLLADGVTVLSGGTLVPVAMAARAAKLAKMGKVGQAVLKLMPRISAIIEKVGLKTAFGWTKEFITNGGKTLEAMRAAQKVVNPIGVATTAVMIGGITYSLVFSESETNFEMDPELIAEEGELVEDPAQQAA